MAALSEAHASNGFLAQNPFTLCGQLRFAKSSGSRVDDETFELRPSGQIAPDVLVDEIG